MDNSDLSLSQSLKLNSDNSDAVDISLPDAVKHTPDYNFFIEIHVKDLSQKITLFIQELKKLHEGNFNFIFKFCFSNPINLIYFCRIEK